MVVLYRQEPNGSYFLQIEPAVSKVRQWVIGRLEYQPIGVVQIESPLALPIGNQGMTPSRQRHHHLEIARRSQVIQPTFQTPCRFLALPPDLAIVEDDLQRVPAR
jgi:hypothetical protein